jgi:nucleoid-associated protein YgaU
MFNEMGIPVRATVNVSMKEYKSVSDQLKEIPRYSSDRTKQWSVKQGESLSYIAGEEYGDPELWRSVAKKNGIINPRKLKAGTDIVIPPLE